MPRPKRASAQKPEGYYAPASSTRTRTGAATARAEKKRKTDDEPEIPGRPSSVPGPITIITPEPLDPAALALDLKRSYEDTIPIPSLERPKRQKRWRRPADNPIEYITELPAGWNYDEPDLDPDDLESQIERCRERISDNILTHEFKFKLEDLVRKKTRQEEMMALEPAGLSWPVVERLSSLDEILKWLHTKGDKYELVGNVTNIMAAYRSGELKWLPGLVTYWSKGVQLCQPRPFRWNEFDLINAENQGHTGFWVEGLEGPGPIPQMPITWVAAPKTASSTDFMSYMDIYIKIPNTNALTSKAVRLDFLDDTGACLMQINQSDADRIWNCNIDYLGNIPPAPPIIGVANILVASGHTVQSPCIRYEVNMFNEGDNSLLSPVWHPIQVLVVDDSITGPRPRLNGPWARHRMYETSVPNGTRMHFFSQDHPYGTVLPVASVLDMNRLLPDHILSPVPPMPALPAS